MMLYEATLETVIDVVADTFDTPAADLGPQTTAEDVDGWDSLAHTVLMVRLGRRLGVEVPERIAASAGSLGELANMLAALPTVQGRAA